MQNTTPNKKISADLHAATGDDQGVVKHFETGVAAYRDVVYEGKTFRVLVDFQRDGKNHATGGISVSAPDDEDPNSKRIGAIRSKNDGYVSFGEGGDHQRKHAPGLAKTMTDTLESIMTAKKGQIESLTEQEAIKLLEAYNKFKTITENDKVSVREGHGIKDAFGAAKKEGDRGL
jgi:hypothetical protein